MLVLGKKDCLQKPPNNLVREQVYKKNQNSEKKNRMVLRDSQNNTAASCVLHEYMSITANYRIVDNFISPPYSINSQPFIVKVFSQIKITTLKCLLIKQK